MGLFDTIAGAVGNALGSQEGGAQNILENLLKQGGNGQSGGIVGQLLGGLSGGAGSTGGMAAVLQTLAASGLGEQVSSWVSNNPNLPVSMDQIRAALGSDEVAKMAEQAGLPVGDFLKHLAQHLPQAASEAAGVPPNG